MKEMKIINEETAILIPYVIITVILSIGILLGWLIPIKSPYENTEEYDIPKKHKHVAGAIKPPVKEMLLDLNGDDIPEWYLVVPEIYDFEE